MNMHLDKKEQCAQENISLQKLIYDYVVYITFHHTSESDDDDDECGECIQWKSNFRWFKTHSFKSDI